MDQRNKKQDVAAAVPPHKQQEGKRNLGAGITEEKDNRGEQVEEEEQEERSQAAQIPKVLFFNLVNYDVKSSYFE